MALKIRFFNEEPKSRYKSALYFGIKVLVLAEDILPMQSIIRFMNREHIVETSDLMVS